MLKKVFKFDGCIKNAIALFTVIAVLFCVLPQSVAPVTGAEDDAMPIVPTAPNDGVNFFDIFRKDNGIYLGSYNHAAEVETSGEGLNQVKLYEAAPSPVLWQVNENFINDYSPVSLTSVYVLDTRTRLETDNFLNFNPFFIQQEVSIIESLSLLDTNLLDFYYPVEDINAFNSSRVASLKGSNNAIDWWLSDAHVNPVGGIQSDFAVDDYNYRGIRPHITLNPENIIYASSVDGKNYSLTILDDDDYNPLELTELRTLGTESENPDESEEPEIIDEYTVIPVSDQYLSLVADTNRVGDYSINYKIVKVFDENDRMRDEIVAYRVGASSVKEKDNMFIINPTDMEGQRLANGTYLVYVWLQQSKSTNSDLASEPLSFTIDVRGAGSGIAAVSVGDNRITDFGIVVDYCNELIRLVDASMGIVETGDPAFVNEYKSKAIDFAVNANNKPKYMYALKAKPASDISEKKLAQTLLSEKWYPIYGDAENGYTIDISKVLPKSGKSPYYIAIRKANDVFESDTGYRSRLTVQLKPRQSESAFKKQIKYDPENELFYSDSEIKVMYRMNYFSKLSSATLTVKTDRANNIKVEADKYALGGVMYVSALPVFDDSGVSYAASKPVKVSIPKRLSVPSVKIDNSGKKLTSLKRNSTEYCYDYNPDSDSNNWIQYSSAATSIELSKLSNLQEIFPEIALDSDNTNYVLYFRTKSTAKAPASEVKTVLIPRNLINEYE